MSKQDFSKHPETVDRYLRGASRQERRGQIESARKKAVRRNLEPKGPRKKGWDALGEEAWDDMGLDANERIMPIDENDRRKDLARAVFAPPRETELGTSMPGTDHPETAVRGTVLTVNSGLCTVETGDGSPLPCTIRSSITAAETGFTNAVAAGDEVIYTPGVAGAGIIEQVLPRRSALTRQDVFLKHLRQVVVANADQVLIVASWREPVIWLELIDRYLIAARRSGLGAVVCVNKVDLAESLAEVDGAMQPYRELGFEVIKASARTGQGIESLRQTLEGKVTVLVGMSGAGKSSLVTAVQPGLTIRTSEVRAQSGEGRHTTTQAALFRLANCGAVVDTPGIREFGIAGLTRRELGGYFPEFARATVCRFADCAHMAEPDCGVQAAVASGAIARSRYHSYTLIYAALPL